ncbi:MAG: FIST C-terminal domain-containing protein [Planctomycetes bacterium]|nr:FIST C-terminal domain-containing protein [Planctomycetota bacterium]
MTDPRFASALSTHTDSAVAFEEVVTELRTALAGAKPDLLAVFVSHHHGPAIETLGSRLSGALGGGALIGCTGEGIVGSAREVERGACLSVWAGVLPNTDIRPFAVQAEPISDDTLRFTAMPDVQDKARASMLLLADPFSFPAHAYLDALNTELPGVPAIGGMASGGQGPGQNLLFTENDLVDGGAIGVVVEGDVEVRAVVSQGCRPVGKPFVITSCKDNFVLKLSGKPALTALMETIQGLPNDDQKLMQRGPFLGLALDPQKSTFERGDFLVRGIIGIEKESNALAVADDSIRSGMSVQFLVRDAASAGEDLTHLVRDHVGRVSAPTSTGALLFCCNGRGTRMFKRPDHDIECLRAGVEAEIPAAGFFAMGEIGPVGQRNFLHGFTASIALFRRRN